MVHQAHNFTLDSAIQMKDAGLVASSAAATVGGSAKVHDIGAAGYQRFALVIDVSAVEAATGDENYTILVQGATASSFSTAYTLARTSLGDSAQAGQPIDSLPGRYVVYGDNVINLAGSQTSQVQYLRVYTVVAGTIATGINFQAWLVPIA